MLRLVPDASNPTNEEWQLPTRGEAVVGFNNTYAETQAQRFLLTLQRDVKSLRVEGLNVKTGSERLLQVAYNSTGSKVLVQIGEELDYSGFGIYLWDTQKNSIRLVSPRGLAYNKVEGSPNFDFLAYVDNVDQFAYPVKELTAKLYVLNVKTQKERLVVSNNGVINGFCWRGNTLFYSAFPPSAKEGALVRPSIYSLSFDKPNSKPRLIAKDAYRALPSPDGKRIAFFGPENRRTMSPLRAQWMSNPYGDALCVMNADGTKRKALNREQRSYPQLRWLDNENLISLKITEFSPKGAASLRQVNVKSGIFKTIAELEAEDYKTIDYDTEFFPQFELQEVVNKQEVACLIRRTLGSKRFPYISLRYGTSQVVSVDIQSGKQQQIMQIPSGYSFDWRPNATQPQSTTSE